MDHSLISVRYAKAIFGLSQEKNLVEQIYHDMVLLGSQCSNVPSFTEILKSPVISPNEKKKVFQSIFEKYISEITMNFLNVLIDNKREEFLSDIARNFVDFYKKQTGLKTVTLFTAFQLSDEYIDNIKILLEKELNAKIELNVNIREYLIGGFILMVDGKMLDVSIFNKLKALKRKLLS